MADGFAVAIVSVLLAGFGMVIGTKVGDELSKRVVTARGCWCFIFLIMLVGSFVFMLVFATGFMVVAALVVGMIAGAIAGLRLGFGAPTSFRRPTDRFFSTSKRAHMGVSKRGKAGRAREEETAEPQLMSVDLQGESTKNIEDF